MIRIVLSSMLAAPILLLATPAVGQNAPATQPSPPTGANEVPAANPPAQTPPSTSPPPVEPPVVSPPPQPKVAKKGPVDGLKPGQFVWENRTGYNNPLRLVAVLDIQRMYVFDGDELVGFTTISSGKKGKETPSGIFKILQKKEYHESNIYANAPMPFMQRLTWDGIALHAGHLPGYPASHGCIRLPKVFAKALYSATQMDGEVVILESLSKPLARPKPVKPPVAEPLPPQPTVPVQPAEPIPSPTPTAK